MNATKNFFRFIPIGSEVTFQYEGNTRSGFINFIGDRVVNIYCNTRLAYRSFSYDKIQLM